MAELRVWAREMSQRDYGRYAKESTQFMIIKEGKTIPEAGIEFDVPDKDASRMAKAILGGRAADARELRAPSQQRLGKSVPVGGCL